MNRDRGDSQGRAGGHGPLASIDAIVAFRHVGPFPEWAEHHPRHKDVVLCLDCVSEWCAATIDPTFEHRVIADGVAYLDADGHETDAATDRYLEAVTRQELLEMGAPKHCEACLTPWNRVRGAMVTFR